MCLGVYVMQRKDNMHLTALHFHEIVIFDRILSGPQALLKVIQECECDL